MKLGWVDRATGSKMGLAGRWWWRWCGRFPFGYATPTVEIGTSLRWVSLMCGGVTGSAMGLSLFFSFFLRFCLLLCSIWFLLLGFVLFCFVFCFFVFFLFFYLFFWTYMGLRLLTRLVGWDRGAQVFFLLLLFFNFTCSKKNFLGLGGARAPLGPHLGLSLLVALRVGYNQLVGEIPTTLTSMTKLQFFSIHMNNLTGTVSPFFENLSFLRGFSASFNNLGGSIPNSFGQLMKLPFFLVCNMIGFLEPFLT